MCAVCLFVFHHITVVALPKQRNPCFFLSLSMGGGSGAFCHLTLTMMLQYCGCSMILSVVSFTSSVDPWLVAIIICKLLAIFHRVKVIARGAKVYIITDNPKFAQGIDPSPLVIPSNGPLTALIAVLPLQVRYSLLVMSQLVADAQLSFHIFRELSLTCFIAICLIRS
jgi:hypothetical protein